MLRVLKSFKTPFEFHSFSYFNNPITKHKDAASLFFLCYLAPHSMLIPKDISRHCYVSSACPANVYKPFDEMQHREKSLGCSISSALFNQALPHLIGSSMIRPNSLTSVAVHCLALKLGALADLSASTSLLISYSRARDIASARSLFDDMLAKDVIAYNAIITACVDNRFFLAALDFFWEMLVIDGIGYDSTTLLIVASALSRLNDLKQGRVLHGLSFKSGMLSDSFLCNAFIDMYAKCGDLSSSECMFEGMECGDTTSWNSLMSGCLRSGYPEKSLWYFKEMVQSDARPDHVSLSCVISASSCSGELGLGEAIHGWKIKLGYRNSSCISVANSLISFYSKCGEIEAAQRVFRGMIHKDVVSWNSMIHGFAMNGNIVEALDLLNEMHLTRDVQPDSVTMITIISLCSDLALWQEGRTAHAISIRQGLISNLLVMNSLLDMYAKCESIKTAEVLFTVIPEKDLVSWNTMINGYSQNEHSKEAQHLFRELLRSSTDCNLLTLLAVLPSCDTLEALQFGRSIHCWQLKLGFIKDIIAVNSLMYMYVNCGDLIASLSLLESIFISADIICWNTIIVGCVQNGHFQEALEAFNLMRQETSTNHNSITLVSVLSACGNLDLVFRGRSVHGLALKTMMDLDIRVQNSLLTMYSRCKDIESARLVFSSGSYHNLCSWNCMISGFSQNNDGRRALELFHHLEFEPNKITISTILSACTQLGLLRHGRQIHGSVLRFGLHGNTFICAALVDMYSKCGRLDIAFKVFQNSSEKSVASWNSMIAAYGFHSNGKKAIELFDEMCKSGAKATKSTFVSLLSACSHLGMTNEGFWYYKHMLEKFGVEPATEHHVCMVDMLGRSGRLQEAYEFIRDISMQPAPGVWGALLSACNYHGDLQMGRQVADYLFGLEPDNTSYYVSLSNMYVAAGRWNEALEVREMIQDKGLRKQPGYSLIDISLI